MTRIIAIFAVALAAVVAGSHAASAGDPLCEWLPFLPGCGSGTHGGNPAPAPLLAAGIPAFTALGGGVLVAKLFRKRKTRS